MKPTTDWHTPTLRINDGRGLPVRHVAYWRKTAGATAQALATRHVHDALGRLTEQWDPRLYGSAPKPNMTSAYRLSGTALRVDSVDAGQRLSLTGIAHQVLQRWDARGTHWQTDYDDQLRIVAVNQRPDGQAPETLERLTYADATGDPAFNRRGQLTRLIDLSGELDINRFSLHGQPLEETRTFADGPAFTSHWQYSASAQLRLQTDAAGHRQLSRFDVAGQLKDIRLQLKDASAPQIIINALHYNAAGQLETKTSANGLLSTWTYDPADGRLSALKSGVAGHDFQQDLSYTYDPVGNVLHIDDHTMPPVFFANQRVDGHRSFTYDSLYQLISASGFEGETPHLQPGLPELIMPEAPGARFNYTQHYDYDPGGNLTRLRHVRDGHCYTRCMRIDPHSNRGLAWQEGDPDPVFDDAFDAHGNLKALNNNQPLRWNTQDQLADITLIRRETGVDDKETYTYSQGARVYKHQVTQAKSVSHTRDVRYLPGLEVRILDDSEELHIITLPGSVRCLHWVKGQPEGIDKTQLRYSLDDHLGSSNLELGEKGERISHEVYYPFGSTAWWSARSAIDADYKTVRYSGKEMDASGLYYYGARYYAPWLQRWVSADPAGDVDGLNLYAMVGNNPIGFIDSNGEVKWPSAAALNAGIDRLITSENAGYQRSRERLASRRLRSGLDDSIMKHLAVMGITNRAALDTQQQILNHRSASEHGKSTFRRTATLLVGNVLSYGAGIAVGVGLQPLATAAPGVGNVAVIGLGFAVKKGVSAAVDKIAESTGLSASVKLKASNLDPGAIFGRAEDEMKGPLNKGLKKFLRGMDVSTTAGQKDMTKMIVGEGLKAALPAVGSAASTSFNAVMAVPEILHEVHGAGKEISEGKRDRLDANITDLIGALNAHVGKVEDFFHANGVATFKGVELEELKMESSRTVTLLEDTRTLLHSRSSRFEAA